MTYRNDHDAALARIAALEHELREAHREIARQRGPAVDIELPEIARTRQSYDDSWTSTSDEADRELSEALQDAKAYRREQDAHGGRDESRTTDARFSLRRQADALQPSEPTVTTVTVLFAIAISVFFIVAMVALLSSR